MAKRVLRFPVPVSNDPQQVHIPDDAEILHVDTKTFGFVDVWVETNGATETVVRTFQVFSTGDNIPEDAMYVGTTLNRVETFGQLMATAVWHLYERVF